MTDELPFYDGHESPATPTGAKGTRCRRHDWYANACRRCGVMENPVLVRRGRNNRARGNRHELKVARLYGGEKTGPLGQPEDIRGADFRTQVKTHQGLPPLRWRAVFAALDTQSDGRLPRLIERYLPGQGIAPDDYIVIRGADWLAWFGRDE